MKLDFLSYNNQKNIISQVKLQKLTINRDKRGMLVETLREDWKEVFHRPDLQFGQSYYSITNLGFARDEDQWHIHPTKQTDRFVILSGNAVVALCDWRKESKTYRMLNLFLMGEQNGDNNQYLLLIPINVLHAFCNVGSTPCGLFSFPDHMYDPKEEGRIPFSEANVRFPDGTQFSWNVIRQQFQH